MNGKEKRRAARIKHNTVIDILDMEGEVAVSSRLIDVSATGASFSMGDPLPIAGRFGARLRFMDKSVIEVKAHVVWTRKEKNLLRYGIKFDSLRQLRPPENQTASVIKW
ncbi:MAG: PilZ domain-containing protein [Elusimicrobia bacterium]|nr:PilZ domain-containing protein [Elusimicrobiota bacterium]